MKKVKKVLCFVLPLVLVVAIALGVVLPVSLAAPEATERQASIRYISDFGGQVVYAADSSGAAAAARDYKGGAIFLEPNCTMTMSGGTISGHQNTYGGAIYISDGATFTMTGGTISGNTATYGGAIYVEAGGRCVIDGGTIDGNTAKTAPAIYVENGATFEFVSGYIQDNTSSAGEMEEYYAGCFLDDEFMAFYAKINEFEGNMSVVSQDKLVLPTMKFGSYPQSYVGDEMNDTLTAWRDSQSPAPAATYEMVDRTWQAYKYTDGKVYANGQSSPDETINNLLQYGGIDLETTYRDGSAIIETGQEVWFEVEPINWFILNYDAWQAGKEKIEIFSELVLTADIRYTDDLYGSSWKESTIRSWLNGNFYDTAFTSEEKQQIVTKTNKNNAADDAEYEQEPSTWTGEDTQDNVWLPSYYDMMREDGIWYGEVTLSFDGQEETGPLGNLAWCTLSDFAISNDCFWMPIGTFKYRKGVSGYWLRSVKSEFGPCYISPLISGGYSGYNKSNGVRPALQLNIAA